MSVGGCGIGWWGGCVFHVVVGPACGLVVSRVVFVLRVAGGLFAAFGCICMGFAHFCWFIGFSRFLGFSSCAGVAQGTRTSDTCLKVEYEMNSQFREMQVPFDGRIEVTQASVSETQQWT